MVFWNQKKKRTTAKPKTTASISNPKVGSVKQELNISPQPKKTDIPKPKNENVKKQFLKTFNQLTYRHRLKNTISGSKSGSRNWLPM